MRSRSAVGTGGDLPVIKEFRSWSWRTSVHVRRGTANLVTADFEDKAYLRDHATSGRGAVAPLGKQSATKRGTPL